MSQLISKLNKISKRKKYTTRNKVIMITRNDLKGSAAIFLLILKFQEGLQPHWNLHSFHKNNTFWNRRTWVENG